MAAAAACMCSSHATATDVCSAWPAQRARRGIPSLRPVWCAEFIGQNGDVTPEYLDFVAAPGREEQVIDGFLQQLIGDRRVDALDLQAVPECSPTVARVAALRLAPRGRFRRSQDAICPILDLPPSVEAFHASRSRNYRKKMGEYERRAQRDLGITLRRSGSSAEVQTDMAALIALHRERWSSASRAFRSREYVDFHLQLAGLLLESGWLRLFSLDSRGAPLALLYCFAYDGRYHYYQAGRDPAHAKHRVGLVLMHRAILEAIQEGATVFDFLRGGEEYKAHWARSSVSCVRLEVWKTGQARAAMEAQSLALRAREAVGRLWRRLRRG